MDNANNFQKEPHHYVIVFQTVQQNKISIKEIFLQDSEEVLSKQDAVANLKNFLIKKHIPFESLNILDFREPKEEVFDDLRRGVGIVIIDYIRSVVNESV